MPIFTIKCRNASGLAAFTVLSAARGLICITLSLPVVLWAQQAPPRYRVVDEGPSLVRTLSDTPGFNNQGDIAIWHVIDASLMPGMVSHAGQSFSISGDPEFSLVYPADLNQQLTVVGTLQQPQDLRFTRAFKWSHDHLQTLASLGGPYSSATAVNAAGEVVGSADTGAGTRHAVLWHSALPRDLGLLAHGDYSRAHDVNDQTEVVGEANLVPRGKPQAFLWREGRMSLLPRLPGGAICSAQAINNSGLITGSCDSANGAAHAVLWRNGSIEDLGTLGDDDAPSNALDINASGQIVGTSEANNDKLRAFLWQKGKMTNLNQLIPPGSGWLLLVASRINDNGEILGRGYYQGYIHAFLLEPEPLSITSTKGSRNR